MFFKGVPTALFWPMFILSTLAAIIASQASITGAFTVISQAVHLEYFPRIKIVHTSNKVIGRIYLPSFNFWLCVATIIVVVIFRTSDALANAYGVTVCAIMLLTTFLMSVVSVYVWHWHTLFALLAFLGFGFVDSLYAVATLFKLADGGWLPVVFSAFLVAVMNTVRAGNSVARVAEQNVRLHAELYGSLFAIEAGENDRSVRGLFLQGMPLHTSPPHLRSKLQPPLSLHSQWKTRAVVGTPNAPAASPSATEAASVAQSTMLQNEEHPSINTTQQPAGPAGPAHHDHHHQHQHQTAGATGLQCGVPPPSNALGGGQLPVILSPSMKPIAASVYDTPKLMGAAAAMFHSRAITGAPTSMPISWAAVPAIAEGVDLPIMEPLQLDAPMITDFVAASQPYVDLLASGVLFQPYNTRKLSIFLTRDADRVPFAFHHFVQLTRCIPESVVFLSVKYENVPFVNDQDRFLWQPATERAGPAWLFSAVIRTGFAERHQLKIHGYVIKHVLKQLESHDFVPTYFLSQRLFTVSRRNSFLRRFWLHFYAFINRNSRSANQFFHLPSGSVMQIGTQIRL